MDAAGAGAASRIRESCCFAMGVEGRKRGRKELNTSTKVRARSGSTEPPVPEPARRLNRLLLVTTPFQN